MVKTVDDPMTEPMTARDDLLERLVAKGVASADGQSHPVLINPDGPEARARIEALEGEVRSLKGHFRIASENACEYFNRTNLAEAQRDEAVKALEPFAAEAKDWPPSALENEVPLLLSTQEGNGCVIARFSLADIGRAAQALASIKGKTNEQ